MGARRSPRRNQTQKRRGPRAMRDTPSPRRNRHTRVAPLAAKLRNRHARAQVQAPDPADVAAALKATTTSRTPCTSRVYRSGRTSTPPSCPCCWIGMSALVKERPPNPVAASRTRLIKNNPRGLHEPPGLNSFLAVGSSSARAAQWGPPAFLAGLHLLSCWLGSRRRRWRVGTSSTAVVPLCGSLRGAS